jgi:TRAP-type mannitol/chloroaromatic compound transport system permease small subunit
MNQEMKLKPVPIADNVDGVIKKIGHGISWVYIILIAVIITQVILRRGFGSGLIALEELQWHLYAVGVMFGLAYAQVTNAHVRVDVVSNNLSNKWKHIIEITGIIFLLLPFLYVIFYHSLDFVYEAFRSSERSNAPSGLPFRWLIKSVIPVSIGLLILASLNRLYREVVLLKRGE